MSERLPRALFICMGTPAGRRWPGLLRATRAARVALGWLGAGEAELHPEVVEAMREVGLEVGGRRPKGLASEDVEWAELVVTMGCGDACPVLPGKRYLDWELPDPAGAPLDEVRAVRDEIDRRVAELGS